MKPLKLRIGCALVLGFLIASPAAAELSADQIARLGRDLTPLGGERAGNASGTIPAWTGGITSPPAGYSLGDHHPDPYSSDRPLYTVTGENMDRYSNLLSVGHQAMLDRYPSFSMTVYPTRRSASAPQRIYDATRQVAATARLVDDGNGVAGSVIGIPFPIPKNGLEVIWNHLLRYRGETVSCELGQAAVTRSGDYTLVRYGVDVEMRYSLPGMTEERLGNIILYFKQSVSGTRTVGRRTSSRSRDDQPGPRTPQRVGVQPRAATGAARAECRL